ncbi:MAG: SGNH/GDSL hydrolase family protein [Lachnospiraceae bacterium]|jgi:hypothetical protein|nr:SGNH/GDSL hydrolase family protein [Lachnospiraceae bacterium]
MKKRLLTLILTGMVAAAAWSGSGTAAYAAGGGATAGAGITAETAETTGSADVTSDALALGQAVAQQTFAAAIAQGKDQATAFALAQQAAQNTITQYLSGIAGAAAGTGTAASGTAASGTAAAAVPAKTGNTVTDTAITRGLWTKYAGKKVSITSDSINTFDQYNPAWYGTMYPMGDVLNVSQTWWKMVLDATGESLDVNASWAGSKVCGNSLDTTGKTGCGMKRIFDLTGKGGVKPDVIWVILGTNDMIAGTPLGTYYAGKPIPAEGEITNFADGYDLMLAKLGGVYPNATIICFTCFPDTDVATGNRHTNSLGLTIEDYNAMIKKIAAGHGLQCVDVWNCNMNRQNAATTTIEGIHPSAQGFLLAASYVVN